MFCLRGHQTLQGQGHEDDPSPPPSPLKTRCLIVHNTQHTMWYFFQMDVAYLDERPHRGMPTAETKCSWICLVVHVVDMSAKCWQNVQMSSNFTDIFDHFFDINLSLLGGTR